MGKGPIGPFRPIKSSADRLETAGALFFSFYPSIRLVKLPEESGRAAVARPLTRCQFSVDAVVVAWRFDFHAFSRPPLVVSLLKYAPRSVLLLDGDAGRRAI